MDDNISIETAGIHHEEFAGFILRLKPLYKPQKTLNFCKKNETQPI